MYLHKGLEVTIINIYRVYYLMLQLRFIVNPSYIFGYIDIYLDTYVSKLNL